MPQQLCPVVIMKALWTHDVRVCEMQVGKAHPAMLLLGLLHMQRRLPNHPLDARKCERHWMGVNGSSWFIVADMCACPMPCFVMCVFRCLAGRRLVFRLAVREHTMASNSRYVI